MDIVVAVVKRPAGKDDETRLNERTKGFEPRQELARGKPGDGAIHPAEREISILGRILSRDHLRQVVVDARSRGASVMMTVSARHPHYHRVLGQELDRGNRGAKHQISVSRLGEA